MVDTKGDSGGLRAEGQAWARPHVYVINRSPEFIDVFYQLLDENGYRVTVANILPVAMEAIDQPQISLVIVDVSLGPMGGWLQLERFRHAVTTQGIRVLLVASTPDALHAVQDRNRRFLSDPYLISPFSVDDLLLTIEDLIGPA